MLIPDNRTAKYIYIYNYFDNHLFSVRCSHICTDLGGGVPVTPHKSIWQVLIITGTFHIGISYFLTSSLHWNPETMCIIPTVSERIKYLGICFTKEMKTDWPMSSLIYAVISWLRPHKIILSFFFVPPYITCSYEFATNYHPSPFSITAFHVFPPTWVSVHFTFSKYNSSIYQNIITWNNSLYVVSWQNLCSHSMHTHALVWIWWWFQEPL